MRRDSKFTEASAAPESTAGNGPSGRIRWVREVELQSEGAEMVNCDWVMLGL